MSCVVLRAAEASDLDGVRELFREYAALVADAVCFQSYELEMAGLPGRYGMPDGRLIIAVDGERLLGCVALRSLEPGVCEMKRLYLRPESRNTGLGRRLAERIVAEAKAAGYRVLRLDTLPRLERAIRLYRALGFYEIPRYGENPVSAICFEIAL